jgi:hypothetical protein
MYTWFARRPASGRLALVFGTLVKRADRVRSIDESDGSQEGATQMTLKKLMMAMGLVALMWAPAAFAVDGPVLVADIPAIQPIPDAAVSGAPALGAQPVPVQGAPALALYTNVRYKSERKVAPCAVPQIVMVKDPCAKCDPCNPCAAPQCVAVQICVPPCPPCPPKVVCRRGGEYVCYDFGKYRVEIRSKKNGCVVVDYDA